MEREEVKMEIKTAVELWGLVPIVVITGISQSGLFPKSLSSLEYDKEDHRIYIEEGAVLVYDSQQAYFFQEGQEYSPEEYNMAIRALDTALIVLTRKYQDVFIGQMGEGGFNYNFTPPDF